MVKNCLIYGNVSLLKFEGKQIAAKFIKIQQENSVVLKQAIKQIALTIVASQIEAGMLFQRCAGFEAILYKDGIQFFVERCLTQLKQSFIRTQRKQKNLKKNLYKLHGLRICHLDIKPQNIGWSPRRKKLVFLDFGFSMHIKEFVGTKTFISFIGTFSYTSPEMRKLYFLKSPGFIDLYYNDIYGLFKSIKKLQQEQQYESDEQQSKVKIEVNGVCLQLSIDMPKNKSKQQNPQYENLIISSQCPLMNYFRFKFALITMNDQLAVQILKKEEKLLKTFYHLLHQQISDVKFKELRDKYEDFLDLIKDRLQKQQNLQDIEFLYQLMKNKAKQKTEGTIIKQIMTFADQKQISKIANYLYDKEWTIHIFIFLFLRWDKENERRRRKLCNDLYSWFFPNTSKDIQKANTTSQYLFLAIQFFDILIQMDDCIFVYLQIIKSCFLIMEDIERINDIQKRILKKVQNKREKMMTVFEFYVEKFIMGRFFHNYSMDYISEIQKLEPDCDQNSQERLKFDEDKKIILELIQLLTQLKKISSSCSVDSAQISNKTIRKIKEKCSKLLYLKCLKALIFFISQQLNNQADRVIYEIFDKKNLAYTNLRVALLKIQIKNVQSVLLKWKIQPNPLLEIKIKSDDLYNFFQPMQVLTVEKKENASMKIKKKITDLLEVEKQIYLRNTQYLSMDNMKLSFFSHNLSETEFLKILIMKIKNFCVQTAAKNQSNIQSLISFIFFCKKYMPNGQKKAEQNQKNNLKNIIKQQILKMLQILAKQSLSYFLTLKIRLVSSLLMEEIDKSLELIKKGINENQSQYEIIDLMSHFFDYTFVKPFYFEVQSIKKQIFRQFQEKINIEKLTVIRYCNSYNLIFPILDYLIDCRQYYRVMNYLLSVVKFIVLQGKKAQVCTYLIASYLNKMLAIPQKQLLQISYSISKQFSMETTSQLGAFYYYLFICTRKLVKKYMQKKMLKRLILLSIAGKGRVEGANYFKFERIMRLYIAQLFGLKNKRKQYLHQKNLRILGGANFQQLTQKINAISCNIVLQKLGTKYKKMKAINVSVKDQ